MRSWDQKLAVLIVITIAVIAFCVGGCNKAQLPPSFGVAGNGVASMNTRAQTIKSSAEKVTGRANEPHKATIIEQATELQKDAKETQRAIEQSKNDYVAKDDECKAAKAETAAVKADPWHKAAMFVKWIWRLYVTLLVILLVMRIAALFVTGPVGSIMATVSTVGLGILTLGISATTSAADNYWFRKRAAK